MKRAKLRERIVLIFAAAFMLFWGGFEFVAGIMEAPHTARNWCVICFQFLVQITACACFLMMLREGGISRKNAQVLAVFLVVFALGFIVARSM